MVLSDWVMSWETPESKSNSSEYWLVMFEMIFGAKDPLLCKKPFRTPAMVPFDSPMSYICFVQEDASSLRSVESFFSVSGGSV